MIAHPVFVQFTVVRVPALLRWLPPEPLAALLLLATGAWHG